MAQVIITLHPFETAEAAETAAAAIREAGYVDYPDGAGGTARVTAGSVAVQAD